MCHLATKSHGIFRQAGKQAGFTLIEVMVTVVISTIMLAFAMPKLNGMFVRSSMDMEANRMLAFLSAARAEALRTNKPVIVCATRMEGEDILNPSGESIGQGRLECVEMNAAAHAFIAFTDDELLGKWKSEYANNIFRRANYIGFGEGALPWNKFKVRTKVYRKVFQNGNWSGSYTRLADCYLIFTPDMRLFRAGKRGLSVGRENTFSQEADASQVVISMTSTSLLARGSNLQGLERRIILTNGRPEMCTANDDRIACTARLP